ncbi:flagellar protein FlgN [Halopseudomonas nanhaiensis]|uniref:flagella synthesis protein FlgN n=1 Tax=Halopseudomonas nanhaiensis TaxID=2830842 RepID=UPI001CBF301E|nr:flagellar protein FlgN [Halopseudomonas nanhaiensis]UAW97447.1 flagellar protein FlgN [Halopseudomonas nanhaiensis]
MIDLQTIFDQAIQDCQQFLDLLDQEQDALGRHDMPELERLLDLKSPLIKALSLHDQAIAGWCQQTGKRPEQSLEHFIASLGQPQLVEGYDAFREVLERCQSANQRNARLVRHSQYATGHLIDLLRNQGESSQSVYDRQGLTSRSSSQRPLTKV